MAVEQRELAANEVLLKVEDLRTQFFTEQGVVKAVDGLATVNKEGTRHRRRERLRQEHHCAVHYAALAGTKGKDSLRHHSFYPPEGGSIDITKLDRHSPEMRRIRGQHIAMIFQEPMTS